MTTTQGATPLDKLVDLLDLETIEVDIFRGKQPHEALQRVFGGQVAGQALTLLPYVYAAVGRGHASDGLPAASGRLLLLAVRTWRSGFTGPEGGRRYGGFRRLLGFLGLFIAA